MIYLVLGRRELGKTTLARYMAHAKRPRIILDPRAQWEVAAPYTSVKTEMMLEQLATGDKDVVLQPVDLQESADRLATVAHLWFQEPREPHEGPRQLSVVLDEAGLYDVRAWDWMMRCSPRRYTSIILTAHRPRDISTNVRSLADSWCLFRTTQSHDLDAIEERCGEAVVNHVQRLKPFEFIVWDDAKATMAIHRDPTAWVNPDARPLVGEPFMGAPPRRLWE